MSLGVLSSPLAGGRGVSALGDSARGPNPAPQQLPRLRAPWSGCSSLGQHEWTPPIGHPPVARSMEWPDTLLPHILKKHFYILIFLKTDPHPPVRSGRPPSGPPSDTPFSLFASRLARSLVCFSGAPRASPRPGLPLGAPCLGPQGGGAASCPWRAPASEGAGGGSLWPAQLTVSRTALVTVRTAVVHLLTCLFPHLHAGPL